MGQVSSRGPSAAAVRKYREFNGHEPTHVDMSDAFRWPVWCYQMGPAIYEVYRSKKMDPETGVFPKKPRDYIHHHDPGVMLHRCDPAAKRLAGARPKRIPAWLRSTRSLGLIGQCLEWQYEYGDDDVTAEASAPYPNLYCTPNGRALVVLSPRDKVLVLMWGGKLRVEARGIVG